MRSLLFLLVACPIDGLQLISVPGGWDRTDLHFFSFFLTNREDQGGFEGKTMCDGFSIDGTQCFFYLREVGMDSLFLLFL